MKKLIYEIPVHDDNDAEMIAREIEAILGIRPARVEEVALLARQAGSGFRTFGRRGSLLPIGCSG